MRVRKVTATGDMTFGQQRSNFWQDQPEAVAQIVASRLQLWRGQWFLDTTDGTDWLGSVLGNNTTNKRDAALRARILTTPGVLQIDNYNSRLDPDNRGFAVAFGLSTQFGSYRFQTQFKTPTAMAIRPPTEPINVAAVVLSQTSILVTWQSGS